MEYRGGAPSSRGAIQRETHQPCERSEPKTRVLKGQNILAWGKAEGRRPRYDAQKQFPLFFSIRFGAPRPLRAKPDGKKGEAGPKRLRLRSTNGRSVNALTLHTLTLPAPPHPPRSKRAIRSSSGGWVAKRRANPPARPEIFSAWKAEDCWAAAASASGS